MYSILEWFEPCAFCGDILRLLFACFPQVARFYSASSEEQTHFLFTSTLKESFLVLWIEILFAIIRTRDRVAFLDPWIIMSSSRYLPSLLAAALLILCVHARSGDTASVVSGEAGAGPGVARQNLYAGVKRGAATPPSASKRPSPAIAGTAVAAGVPQEVDIDARANANLRASAQAGLTVATTARNFALGRLLNASEVQEADSAICFLSGDVELRNPLFSAAPLSMYKSHVQERLFVSHDRLLVLQPASRNQLGSRVWYVPLLVRGMWMVSKLPSQLPVSESCMCASPKCKN